MKLTVHTQTSVNLVRAYAPGEVRLHDRRLTQPALLSATRLVDDWHPGDPACMDEAVLEPLLRWEPDVCILGTGARQVFPPPQLIAALAARGVGLEVMDTAAACRTYNVLVTDGRNVAAALVI